MQTQPPFDYAAMILAGDVLALPDDPLWARVEERPATAADAATAVAVRYRGETVAWILPTVAGAAHPGTRSAMHVQGLRAYLTDADCALAMSQDTSEVSQLRDEIDELRTATGQLEDQLAEAQHRIAELETELDRARSAVTPATIIDYDPATN